MQTTIKIILAVCSIGAVAIGTLTPATLNIIPAGLRLRRRLPLRLWLPSSDMEWMPTRLHGTGWKLRALPIWKVRSRRELTLRKTRREGLR